MIEETIARVGFVHLHVHTSFSLREGAIPVGKLLKLAVADVQPALAVTDGNNLFGALEISEKCAKEGVQPITGCQLTVDFGDAEDFRNRGEVLALDAPQAHIVLLAQNELGYSNLMHLVSQAWLEVEPGDTPHVSVAQLAQASEGLIALSGGPRGPLDQAFRAGKPDAARARLAALAPLFPRRFYIELQRHGLESEAQVEPLLVDLAYAEKLPLVATNEPYFAAASDYEAHDALLCIADGAVVSQDDRRRLTPEHRFKTRAEMVELFADLPEATRNSVEIALRCAYRPLTRKPILPNFTEGTDEAAELRAQAEAGLADRLAKHGPAPGHTEEDYAKRLEFELSIIERMKFPGYFLIVSDFIKWAKSQGIPVGPGRGSGAGSLVAYALTITDLDPIRFSLLFERFLNPERVSMPDFDIDFCQTRRDEVIAYVRRRYGADKVAQIITFGSFLARGVLRNVGRVLEMPLGQVDKLAKMVPQNPAAPVSLKQAIESEPRLREEAEKDSRVKQLLEIAEKLEGLYSNASTHAAGIVIGDRPLDHLVPLYRDPKSDMPATQFNMKWVEPAGLVKFDFLGLKTLTTLATCVALLEKRDIAVDLSKIPLDDKKTFEMLGRGETVGVFQLESAGMRKALSEMRADRFEDIIALVALYRPGPMANIPTYCAVKLGEEDADYIHPKIEPVLKETFGVIIYQEQVMQIAQILSGYSLGEADMLRRAMGKKIKAEMDAQRARFVDGAVERGLEKAKADEIFDLLAKFADYGFNKSHAAAYALVAYQTAWCKANYPVEFLAASMTLDKSNTDKLAEFRNEATRLGMKVDPPSINFSGVDFDVHQRFPGPAVDSLCAVGGQGRRGGAGGGAGFRAGPKAFPRPERAGGAAQSTRSQQEGAGEPGGRRRLRRDRARPGAGLRRGRADPRHGQPHAGRGARRPERAVRRLGAGSPAHPAFRQLVGGGEAAAGVRRHRLFYLGPSARRLPGCLAKIARRRWLSFSRAVKQGASAGRLAATVLDRAERRTKSGNKMGIVTLSDPSGQYEAILFQEGLNQFRDLLEKGATVLVTLQANVEGEDVRARITLVEKLDEAAARIQKGLRIFLRDAASLPMLGEKLKGRGEGEVTLILRLDAPERDVEIKLPGRYPINPQASNAIKAISGVAEVELV